MELNVKTEKKYIWILGYCLILASIVETRTYDLLIVAGIVTCREVNPIILYMVVILVASLGCLVLVRMYDLSETEKKKRNVVILGVIAVCIVVLFCIINLWRLLACMY